MIALDTGRSPGEENPVVLDDTALLPKVHRKKQASGWVDTSEVERRREKKKMHVKEEKERRIDIEDEVKIKVADCG